MDPYPLLSKLLLLVKMDLLFVLKSDAPNGLNTFVYTIAKKLREANHRVSFLFSFILPYGKHQLYKEIGDIYNSIPKKKFDICFLNDNTNWEKYIGLADDIRYVVHGLMNDEFSLPDYKFSRVYCLSKTSFNYIKGDNKVLLYQPIDLQVFRSYNKKNTRLKNILILDSRNTNLYLGFIISAASKLGAFVSVVGMTDYLRNLKNDVQTYINEADLVIAYGRSCYEAMACERPVIVYGINGGDGYITSQNFEYIRETNCSGWGTRLLAKPLSEDPNKTIEGLVNEMNKYKEVNGYLNRQMVKDQDINILYKKFIE